MQNSRLELLTTMASVIFGFYVSLPSVLKAETPTGLACLEQIELPRFAVVNNLPEGGSATAHVVIGRNEQISKLSVSGTARILEAEVEHHIRKRAKYDVRCDGQEFDLEFTFQVEGEPTHTPFIRTFFRPPNRFVISTQPPKHTITFIPVDPEAKKSSPERK